MMASDHMRHEDEDERGSDQSGLVMGAGGSIFAGGVGREGGGGDVPVVLATVSRRFYFVCFCCHNPGFGW